MSEITTKANKVDREITVTMPEVLEMTSLTDLATALGEDLAVQTIKAQLTVSFRSHIRTKLESQTDGEITNSDEDIKAMDFSDWKPETRVRKSAEEKAAELLGKLTPEEIKAAMALAGIE